MSGSPLFAPILELWQDFQEPDFLWQAAALACSLFLGWWGARQIRRRSQAADGERSTLQTFGSDGLRRIAFPLIALAFVLVAHVVLGHWGHVSLLHLAIPLLATLALVRGTIYVLRFTLSNSTWLAASERLVSTSIWLYLAMHIIGLLDPLIEAMRRVSFRLGTQRFDLWMLLSGVVMVLATLLAALWLAGMIENRLMAARHLDPNVRVVLGRVAKALLSLIALLLSLSLIGIDVTALSVFSGALAVGLGLGLQKIASNYVSGFIILLDRSIRIGNVVAVDATTSGVVTQITTRYTVLQTLTGTEVIIPNEYLVSNIVRNQSFTDTQVRLAAPVQVAYSTDLEQAMRLMEDAARAHTRVLDNPPPRALLLAFADSGINLELGFWIADPQEGTGNVRSDVNLMIWRSFRENGIEIPFPQREVRLVGEACRVGTTPPKP